MRAVTAWNRSNGGGFIRKLNLRRLPLRRNDERKLSRSKRKIKQSLIDFHYAFSRLPDSYKTKILTDRSFNDFMITINQFAKRVDTKQDKEPEKLFSFNMYYNFFNIGMDGLIKTMPTDFQQYIDEQMRPILLLMQSISRFSNKKNSEKIAFVKAPKHMVHSADAGETLQ